MSVTEDLTIGYHQQDTDYYCGAACAQMVLDSVGAGLLDQDDLYADNHGHSTTESGWATAPDGLLWTLNNRKPASPTFNGYFVLDALDNEDAISRGIVWTIHHYRVSPVALVFGWAHWIVIRGYTASASPTSFGDTSYSINGFMVNNPWPPVPSATDPTKAPPPPHSASDGCGGGGDRGVADEHIAYSTWQSDYMTGVPGGHWSGKFVAVCDPDPPPSGPGVLSPHLMKALPGDRLIDAATATARAQEGLLSYGLAARGHFKTAMTTSTYGSPTLVQRLDRLDSFYYLVPAHSPDACTPLLVSVDARTGLYKQSLAYAPGAPSHARMLGRSNAQQMVSGQRFELPDRQGRLRVRPEALCHFPTLVWKPCRESLSPFYPFHLFTVGNQRLYVRIDGAVFTELHENDRGI